jgi:hypothetical protein
MGNEWFLIVRMQLAKIGLGRQDLASFGWLLRERVLQGNTPIFLFDWSSTFSFF